MSWSNDVRCLYCDGRLPLYIKITNGQFCSSAHRKAYWQEHERLAVEILHQTHDSLRSHRAPGAVEAILGASVADEETWPLLPVLDAPEPQAGARRNDEPQALDVEQIPVEQISEQQIPEMAGTLAPPGDTAREMADAAMVPMLLQVSPAPINMRAQLPLNTLRMQAGLVRAPPLHSELRQLPVSWISQVQGAFLQDGLRAIDLRADLEAPLFPSAITPVCLSLPRLSLAAGRRYKVETQRASASVAPPGATAREMAGAAMVPMLLQVSPAPIALRAQLPLNILRMQAGLVLAPLLHSGLRQLPSSRTHLARGASLQDGLTAIDLRADLEAPLLLTATAPVCLSLPRLSLAAGRRYKVEMQRGSVWAAPADPEGFAAISTAPQCIALPERRVKATAAAAGGWDQLTPEVTPDVSADLASIGQTPKAHTETHTKNQAALDRNFEPSPTGLLPLACNAKPSQPASDIRPAPPALELPQPLTSQPMRPNSKLEPLEAKPASDWMAESQPVNSPQAVPYGLHWTHTIDFWKRAPRDLKMLVIAIPLLLGLALDVVLPKVRVTAPDAANGIERTVQRALNDRWGNVRQAVFDRAAVALDEDFRSGLDDWSSRGAATAGWSFDATGFVRPGPLALYRPSINLTDYRTQFLGAIDKQALSWVVRAADFDNFYVVKLVVLKSGPLPTIGVVRYAVVNGKADSRVDTIAPIDARTDMLYHVLLDVHGDDFTLSVQGQMADRWSEPRLRRGGIGFFSARGEESRLRWVQVTHQYDMLGRLCAYLAPYNIPTASGSWQR